MKHKLDVKLLDNIMILTIKGTLLDESKRFMLAMTKIDNYIETLILSDNVKQDKKYLQHVAFQLYKKYGEDLSQITSQYINDYYEQYNKLPGVIESKNMDPNRFLCIPEYTKIILN